MKNKKLDSSGQKRKRWQNDLSKSMHMKRILFKFEDSGIAIAPARSQSNKNTHEKAYTVFIRYRKLHLK